LSAKYKKSRLKNRLLNISRPLGVTASKIVATMATIAITVMLAGNTIID
jgi:hypothetical protein